MERFLNRFLRSKSLLAYMHFLDSPGQMHRLEPGRRPGNQDTLLYKVESDAIYITSQECRRS